MTSVIYSKDNPDDIETVETGLFRWRPAKAHAWQPLRVAFEGGLWHVFLNGKPMKGSPNRLAKAISFLLYNAPFHRVDPDEYLRLIEAHRSGRAEADLRRASVR